MVGSMFTIIAAVNRQDVLEGNLLRSPLVGMSEVQFIPARGFPSAGKAYNSGMQGTKGDILVFAHQDVYFPNGWERKLLKNIAKIEQQDSNWAVLGLGGIDRYGQTQGLVWSTGLNREVGSDLAYPVPALSIDELVIILNAKAGIHFDEDLPGFHLYGTDIAQTAILRGMGVYVVEAPVIHNSLPVTKLGDDFCKAYYYMQSKWRQQLPMRTLVIEITRWGLPLKKRQVRQFFRRRNKLSYKRLESPEIKAAELNYE